MIEHNSVLRCSDIKKHFKTESETGVLEILRGVDFSLRKSEIAAIVGSSGSGKSTLLHILGGLDKPTEGEIFWDEESIYTFKTDQLADLRNQKVGFVFQFHHLLPEFTAVENVLMPAYIKGDDFKKAQQRAESLLERFGLSERLNHRPTQLSGGEQQRVSMARALMNKPKIILADEPTGNLDEKNTENILSLLFELRRTDEVSIVLITHEKDIANRCDSVYSLQKGLLEKQV
jgi:lipoprotein-releasing system ATP-binding protein